ncbi:MAG: hypothetical protein JWL77_631 [Chthonomonadaceae bacterium]|nr:hypothetical protein [Chthonomonadaceae bacterium]
MEVAVGFGCQGVVGIVVEIEGEKLTIWRKYVSLSDLFKA